MITRNHEYVIEHFKTHPCVDCGDNDILVLQFDHVEGIKRYNIAALLGTKKGFKTLLDELAKCVVRCANCHARITAQRANSWRLQYIPA